MNRRGFLKASTGGTLLGSTRSRSSAHPGSNVKPARRETSVRTTPAVLIEYKSEDHRRRLQNIGLCERAIRDCLRKHLITGYLPGQCCYNLGEYPCRKVWDPDDWDANELDKLKAHGIGLIQLHEEWNDALRLFGGHKFAPLNPAGFRRFVDMVHRRGMKLIVYVSSAFFQRTDPDFRPEWARDQDLVEIYFDYARCSPASAGWRAYFLPHLVRILDDYALDGIYNDLGYVGLANNPRPPTADEVLAFEESKTHDGALGDLLALIYAEVKRRGGIVKIHHSGASRPATDARMYDYLWVGEGVKDADRLREVVKNFPPYVVPCLDMSRAKIANEDELYLHAIPYMQFPLLLAGRPFTGERALIPGIKYPPEETDFWTRHLRAIGRYYQAHPHGPYSYGWWDSVPGRPEARPTHAHRLKQYLPLVEEGTWAWLEIRDARFFSQPLPPNVVVSAFANRELYLVIANYSHATVEIETTDAFVSASAPVAAPEKRWKLEGRSLHILRRTS